MDYLNSLWRGYYNPVPSLGPIDVHLFKLEDFLLGNDMCCSKWAFASSDRAKTTKQLKRSVEQALSSNKIFNSKAFEKFAVHDPDFVDRLSYFQLREIFDALVSEKAQNDSRGSLKNWLGRYKDNDLEKWSKIIEDYENGGLHFLVSTTYLERLIKHNVPETRSEINRLSKQKADLVKSIARSERAAKMHRLKYDELCAKRGIAGRNLSLELMQLCHTQLPRKLNAVLDLLRSDHVQNGVRYYVEFCKFYHVRDADGESQLPIGNLRRIVFQCVYLPEKPEDTINEPTQTIDWDNSLEPGEIEGAEGGHQNINSVDLKKIDWSALELDYKEPVKDVDQPTHDMKKIPEVTSPGALNLLQKEIREFLKIDLLELRAFLSHRARKLEEALGIDGYKSAWNTAVSNGAPPCILKQSASTITSSVTSIEQIEKIFEDLQELFLINDGGATLDTIVRGIQLEADLADKSAQNISRSEAQMLRIDEEKKALSLILKKKLTEAQNLKVMLQDALTNLLNGRKVTIFGVNA